MKKQYFINANIIDPHNSINENGGLIINEEGKIEAVGKKVNKKILELSSDEAIYDKGDFKHFMAKEIEEQPSTIKTGIKEYVDNLNKDTVNKLEDKNITDEDRYILNHKLDAIKSLEI